MYCRNSCNKDPSAPYGVLFFFIFVKKYIYREIFFFSDSNLNSTVLLETNRNEIE